MANTVESSGTQTAVIGTEHTLAAPTTAAIRVLRVDRNAMVAGDLLTLRVKTKVLTGGTIREQYHWNYPGLPANPVVESIPIVTPFGATFTLQQTAGTGRSYDWSILSFGTPVVESSGTQSATIGTEHSLATPTTNKTRILRVDCVNLAAADLVILRAKTKILTGGTIRAQHTVAYYNAQTAPIMESPVVAGPFGATFTLQQVTAVGRSFDWAVITLD